ncbi:MAG: type II toxin-antitoxin system HicB family antitoxin [Bacteroidetes bacterium]|nr:type II toxin-antitoxin system HicB family antitoxin [Bacteroidota bacterium]
MNTYTAIIEKDTETGLYVGYIPNIDGAHSQAETIEELQENLKEVLELIAEDGGLKETSIFIGIQQIPFAA